MKHTFSLSANIENGFAADAQYIVTPNAQKSIRNIVDSYSAGIHSFTIIGTYGTGKSSFLLAVESDLTKQRKQNYLLESKNLTDADFEILKIVGDYVELSTLLQRKLNVAGSRNSILDELKERKRKKKFLINKLCNCRFRSPFRAVSSSMYSDSCSFFLVEERTDAVGVLVGIGRADAPQQDGKFLVPDVVSSITVIYCKSPINYKYQ